MRGRLLPTKLPNGEGKKSEASIVYAGGSPGSVC